MDVSSLLIDELKKPGSRKALRWLRGFVNAYVGLSWATVGAIVVMRDQSSLVNAPVWVRGIIVALTSLLTAYFSVQTRRGRRRAYIFLRIASAVMLAAVVLIVSLPDDFPIWFKIEQGVCGLLLLGIVFIANGGRMRSVFASR